MRRRRFLAVTGALVLAGCNEISDSAPAADRDSYGVDDTVPSSIPDEDAVELPESVELVDCPADDLESREEVTRQNARSSALRLEIARARTTWDGDDADDSDETDDEPTVRIAAIGDRSNGFRADVGVWSLEDFEYALELWPGESVDDAPRIEADDPSLEPEPIATAIDDALESGAERRVEDDALVAELYYGTGTSQFRIVGRDEPVFARIVAREVHDMVRHRPEAVAHYFFTEERVYRADEPGELPSRGAASVDPDDWLALDCS